MYPLQGSILENQPCLTHFYSIKDRNKVLVPNTAPSLKSVSTTHSYIQPIEDLLGAKN